jgi:peptide deformylase
MLLRSLGVEVASHVIRVGKARSSPAQPTWSEIAALQSQDEVLLNCVDPEAEQKMKAEVDIALRTGDTVGGVFEVVVHGLPPGVGTHANWDERLDGLLAQSVMSLQAVKAVEIGRGVTAAESLGSAVHDAIGYEGEGGFTKFSREQNNAGGIEGGISNGEDIVVRGYLKPISTLRRPLASVSFATREPVKAAYERSDVCVVPAAGVAAEAMVALTVARLAIDKFGGDSLREMQRNFQGYCEQIRRTEANQRTQGKTMRRRPLHKIHEVVKYPDPVLARRAEPVTVFDDALRKLVAEMFESMYAAQGIGLAAPQISISKRITVIDVSFKKDPKDKTRPHQPRGRRDARQADGRRGLPQPPRHPREGAARRLGQGQGAERTRRMVRSRRQELLARALLHEIDHLNGILFIDRISRLKRELVLQNARWSQACKMVALKR